MRSSVFIITGLLTVLSSNVSEATHESVSSALVAKSFERQKKFLFEAIQNSVRAHEAIDSASQETTGLSTKEIAQRKKELFKSAANIHSLLFILLKLQEKYVRVLPSEVGSFPDLKNTKKVFLSNIDTFFLRLGGFQEILSQAQAGKGNLDELIEAIAEAQVKTEQESRLSFNQRLWLHERMTSIASEHQSFAELEKGIKLALDAYLNKFNENLKEAGIPEFKDFQGLLLFIKAASSSLANSLMCEANLE